MATTIQGQFFVDFDNHDNGSDTTLYLPDLQMIQLTEKEAVLLANTILNHYYTSYEKIDS